MAWPPDHKERLQLKDLRSKSMRMTEDSEEYNEDYLSDIKNMIPGISIEQDE